MALLSGALNRPTTRNIALVQCVDGLAAGKSGLTAQTG